MRRALAAWLLVASTAHADAWLPSADDARRARARELAAHLEKLPGVARASVVLFDDAPAVAALDAPAPVTARASVVVVLRAGASLAASDVEKLVPGEVAVVISREPAPPAPALRTLGPFQVAARSYAPLALTLGGALVALAVLGFLLVRSEQIRRS